MKSGVVRAEGLNVNTVNDTDTFVIQRLVGSYREPRIVPVANAVDTALKSGTATLVAGTATVTNADVKADSIILLTCQTPGGTPGFLRVSARVVDTSFTILSSSNTDTSVVGYILINPA